MSEITADSLFGGQDTDGIDVAASVAEFKRLVAEGADPEQLWQDGGWIVADEPVTDGSGRDVRANTQESA